MSFGGGGGGASYASWASRDRERDVFIHLLTNSLSLLGRRIPDATAIWTEVCLVTIYC